MTSEDKTGTQIIAIQNVWHRLLNAVVGAVSYFFGVIALEAAIFINPPPIENTQFWTVTIIVESSFVFLIIFSALLRNIILQYIFRKISHSRFLQLTHFGRISTYFVLSYIAFLFLIGVSANNRAAGLASFGLFFTFSPIYLIFSEPLTSTGEIRLLFELLFENFSFLDSQQCLRAISKKLEDRLKLGNIRLPHNEFVYYANMALLEGRNIENDLRNIEAWMVGEGNLNFESLSNIYPETEFEPWRRVPLSRQVAENPTVVKYAFYMVIVTILLAISPELRSEILELLSKLGV